MFTGRTVTLVQDNSESTPVHNLNFDIEYEFLSLPQEYYISLHYAVPLHKYIAIPKTLNTSIKDYYCKNYVSIFIGLFWLD